ncbi:CoA transferase [uncultured Oscillibacter sp.]|uniref:CaiB/BaiF CoA transferase family protein n=1 Tax=uncultured Oscillibacter sp. TaxID=876091 RepID=UPI002803C69B|nr:CoA transferase [uncultured Oscillibacter sp.]
MMDQRRQMLSGIKVIDLSRNLAAPFCTMILSDLGAEVIKVEEPLKGDDARTYGPFINGKSGYFISINRGKKSVTLNLKDPADKEKLAGLLSGADVMIDNFRPGVLDRLGITEEWVKSLNPSLIFASLTGFGQTGPYRTKAAYDMVVQGYGGIMSITGQTGGEPTRVGVSIGDLAAGLYAAIGILADLYAREKTGRGDRLDFAMMDCQVALLENCMIRYIGTGKVPGPIGNRHASITPFEMFPTADGNLIICAGNTKNWLSLCDAVGLPELKTDPRFDSNDKRNEHHDALREILVEVLRPRGTKAWLKLFEDAGIPCGPVNNIAHVMEDEQVRARNMIVSIDYPGVGEIQAPGCPIKSREYVIDPRTPAPELGANNQEFFG